MIDKLEPSVTDGFDGHFSEVPSLDDVVLVSHSRSSPGITPADMLRHSVGMERFYWAEGNRPLTYAGFGITANLMAWGQDRYQIIQRKARDLFRDAVLSITNQPLAGPRLFGGFAFREDFVPDNTWSVFNPAHFILPHYQLTQVGDETWLTINALLTREDEPGQSLPQLREALDARYELIHQEKGVIPTPEVAEPRRVQVKYPMPYATWEHKIVGATEHMRQSSLDKVVLSRVCEIRFDRRVDVDGALRYLNQHYEDCYRFLFEPRPYHAFYGATPELLAEVLGSTLRTMALAGSIRRGTTPDEDETLAQHLLSDPKERYEHKLVVEAVGRRLANFADELEIPDRATVYRLSNIQHIHTPISARLRHPDGVLPVIEALHPTPALGGSPRHLAMAFIREAEPVPRGWYAAPVGYIDSNMDGTFAVAIRSAVSQERRVWLYAGGGIVADSVPRKEWDETALKFMPMLNALKLDVGDEW
jgi:menaquinone-specific isochorismate synthase